MIVAGINHGVCCEERCRAAVGLEAQVSELDVVRRVAWSRETPSALEGAAATLRAALRAAVAGDRVLYIEDDAVLAPDAQGRFRELLARQAPGASGLPEVLFLFSARAQETTYPGAHWLEWHARPVAGAVACLLSKGAARRAVDLAPEIRSGVPVERLMIEAGGGSDATIWPSLVQHRGELASVHRPGSGGQGTRSPSWDARYSPKRDGSA